MNAGYLLDHMPGWMGSLRFARSSGMSVNLGVGRTT